MLSGTKIGILEISDYRTEIIIQLTMWFKAVKPVCMQAYIVHVSSLMSNNNKQIYAVKNSLKHEML